MDAMIPSDTLAEAELLARVSTLANRSARGLVGRDRADDLAQEVVLDCLLRVRAGRWRIHSTLEALVGSMTRTKHKAALREARRRWARDARHLAYCSAIKPVWMDPARMIEEREEESIRDRALSELPERCRLAYLLVREDGATYRHVARRLGISRAMVGQHVRRAERHLEARLVGPRAWNDTPPSMGCRPRLRRCERPWRPRELPEPPRTE